MEHGQRQVARDSPSQQLGAPLIRADPFFPLQRVDQPKDVEGVAAGPVELICESGIRGGAQPLGGELDGFVGGKRPKLDVQGRLGEDFDGLFDPSYALRNLDVVFDRVEDLRRRLESA